MFTNRDMYWECDVLNVMSACILDSVANSRR